MTHVRFHPSANAEVLAATNWYLERSQTAGAAFVRDLDRAIQRIAEAPERYPLTRSGRRRFVLLKYPFDLVYRVLPNAVEIVALAHHARRPGYWADR